MAVSQSDSTAQQYGYSYPAADREGSADMNREALLKFVYTLIHRSGTSRLTELGRM